MKNCTKVCNPKIMLNAANAKSTKTKLNIHRQGFIPQSQRIMRPDEFAGIKSKQNAQKNGFPANIIAGFLNKSK